MKKELKGFIMGVVATTAILTTTFTVFSQPVTRTIEATYDNIKIYVDGGLISPKDANGNDVEAFTSNGTTYLPVRAISKALGKDVSWDDASRSVYIGNKPAQSTDAGNTTSTYGKVLTVGTAEEFVKAIGSDRKIILKPGVYDLSTVYDVKDLNSCVTWSNVSDGKELLISGVSNLAIEGDTSGKVEIKTAPRYAEILHIVASNNVVIKNIVAGHTPSKYTCNSGVVGFDSCENVSISNSEFYGCGSTGISLSSTKGFRCDSTKIDHCSLRALNFSDSTDVKFTKSTIVDHEAYSNIVYANSYCDVTFEECVFENNNYFTWSFAEIFNNSNLTFNKCIIRNNSVGEKKTQKVSMFKTLDYNCATAGKITLKDTEITGNKCDSLVDEKENLSVENCKIENNSWQK
jgi:Copper amine oxidase N-terminal domain.